MLLPRVWTDLKGREGLKYSQGKLFTYIIFSKFELYILQVCIDVHSWHVNCNFICCKIDICCRIGMGCDVGIIIYDRITFWVPSPQIHWCCLAGISHSLTKTPSSMKVCNLLTTFYFTKLFYYLYLYNLRIWYLCMAYQYVGSRQQRADLHLATIHLLIYFLKSECTLGWLNL